MEVYVIRDLRGRQEVAEEREVHRSDAIGMVAQKRPPALGRWSPPARHILGHARLPDIDAEGRLAYMKMRHYLAVAC
jgi:hypothetical protein